MKTWEDIVKDKLDGYEKTLPEGSLARFHARREESASAPAVKRFPFVWIVAAVVAAGIAALLFLRQPVVPDDASLIVRQPAQPVAQEVVRDTDSTEVTEPVPPAPLIAQVHVPKIVMHVDEHPQEAMIVSNDDMPAAPEENDIPGEPEALSQDDSQEIITDTPLNTTSSPYLPDFPSRRHVSMDVGPAAVGVAGAGALSALAIITPSLLITRDYSFERLPGVDVLCGKPVHYMPLKAGVSVRFPVYEQLSLTTGINYSLYNSQLKYSISGNKKQTVQYLGIPVRLDGTLASNRWFDVYVGGGLEADYCIKALLGDEAIEKGGFDFALLGAGGIQFNINNYLGIYVEPEINLTLPSETPETYRKWYTVSFQVNSGIRLTIRNK